MAKFFAAPDQIEGAHIYITDKGDIRHLTRVLRMSVGDRVAVSDGEAWEYETEISGIYEDEVALLILDKQKFAREPKTLITLYQGIPKAQKMETVIQKTVEMGVNRIVPVFMERTIVVEKGSFEKKLDRWRKIADEAVKQCRRGIIPEVSGSMSFKEMLAEISQKKYDLVLCPYENEEGRSIKNALREFAGRWTREDRGAEIAVLIGPEGGFSKEEISALEGIAETVTLGRTILRTETAGMAALAMIMYEMEL